MSFLGSIGRGLLGGVTGLITGGPGGAIAGALGGLAGGGGSGGGGTRIDPQALLQQRAVAEQLARANALRDRGVQRAEEDWSQRAPLRDLAIQQLLQGPAQRRDLSADFADPSNPFARPVSRPAEQGPPPQLPSAPQGRPMSGIPGALPVRDLIGKLQNFATDRQEARAQEVLAARQAMKQGPQRQAARAAEVQAARSAYKNRNRPTAK